MKETKNIFLLNLLLIVSCASFAQKQTFDVVSYGLPKGWQEQKNEAGIQLSAIDKKTGAYAIVVITKSMVSNADAEENFNNDWFRLVKATVQINGEPTMQNPAKENGWDIISGNTNYTDGTNTGIATLLTATGGDKTVSVVLMTNTSQYQNDLSAFMNSLELSKSLQNKEESTGETSRSTIIGLWKDNLLETSGYINGMPQYTAGYFRKEYIFSNDGTYTFMHKTWSVYQKSIYFAYETGTYTINGNKLSLTPRTGKSEEWGKGADGRTGSWGKLIKSENRELAKTIYTFGIKYYSGSQTTALELYYDKPNEREQQQGNEEGGKRKASYSQSQSGSIITVPPGFTLPSEVK